MYENDPIDSIHVTLTRSSLYGFGIAISGETDETNQQNLIISEIIPNGPADGKLLPNDRIVNVNGHPVIRSMEYTALKLIRESTDFVHLIVQRRKHRSNENHLRKCILNRTQSNDQFGIRIDCQFYIKKLSSKFNEFNLHEGDEILQINEIPVERLTLDEAQNLIDKSKGQIILHTKPKKFINNNSNLCQDYLRPNPGIRYISFSTDTSSIGIRLAGGNKYGLFICEIQSNSIASKSGLFIGDKIFSVNKIDFNNLTREEAVLFLMNMKTTQVNMIVSNLPYEYEKLLADIGGDSFYIRAHFARQSSNDDELSISINDIFHVTDTLYNGQVGSWVATKLNSVVPSKKLTGAIPNRSRAEQLVETAPNLTELMKSKQMSLRRKLRTKFSEKRTRSVLSLNSFKDELWSEKPATWKPLISSKFSTYERVQLKPITIIRPVVLLGPLADIARDQLLSRYPDEYELPEIHLQSHSNIIKLQSIKNIINKNRHCVLDITPQAIEQLNSSQCYPIVIYLKLVDRRLLKEIRYEYGKFYQKSTRRLLETSEHIETNYSYLFTSMMKIDQIDNWFDKIKGQIDFHQDELVWMTNEQMNSNENFQSNEFIYLRNSLKRIASDPSMFSNRNSAIFEFPTKQSTIRSLNFNDRLSTSDSNGSLRKDLLNKSTNNRSIYSSDIGNLHKKISDNLLKQKLSSSLQKPRVYMYDDRNLVNSQTTIVSSSSTSSTQSFKEKNVREVGETRSYSIQDGCNVIGSARGIIDYYGGKLSCPLTGVSLYIPMGAIPEGIEQEIFFEVCQDASRIDQFHGQLLSPIVICGPQGIRFNKSLELTLPHKAGNNAQQMTLMLHGHQQPNSKGNFQQHNGIHQITNSNVSILIDHF